jgi:hypothetical protein
VAYTTQNNENPRNMRKAWNETFFRNIDLFKVKYCIYFTIVAE